MGEVDDATLSERPGAVGRRVGDGGGAGRTAVTAALATRARRRHTVLDLDYRPRSGPTSRPQHGSSARRSRRLTVAVGNRAECRVAVGTDEPDAAASRLLARGVEVAIVKLGAAGVLVATADGRSTVAARRVEVVCGLGAGDAFGGALCTGCSPGWEPERTVEYANAAGAIVAGASDCARTRCRPMPRCSA